MARRRRSVAASVDAAIAPPSPGDVDRLPMDAGSQRRTLEVLRPATAAAQARPMQVDIEMREGAAVNTLQARVDLRSGGLEGSMRVSQQGEDPAVVRHVVANGTVHVSDSALGAEALRIGAGPCSAGVDGTHLLEEVFTGHGRIEGTLSRILLLLSNVRFASRVLDCDGSAYEAMIVLSPWAIHDFYLDAGLEVHRPTMGCGLTRLGFRIENGLLRGLVAEGPHFSDGVARELSATAVYTPIGSFTPLLPEADGTPRLAMSR